MIRYELKTRKNNIIFFCIITILLFWSYLVMLKLPRMVLKIAGKINSSVYVLDFLGIKRIEAITYENIMITTWSILYIFILMWFMYEIMKSVTREKRNGTIKYFLSQPISYKKILSLKLVISIIIFMFQTTVWGIIMWRTSLHGAADVEYLSDMVTEQIKDVMLSFMCVSVFVISVGFLYGSIYNGRRYRSFFISIFGFLILTSLLPNIIRVGLRALERKNFNTDFYKKLFDVMCRIRKINPIYICNPVSAVNHGFSIIAAICIIMISVICVACGIIIYEKRSVVDE